MLMLGKKISFSVRTRLLDVEDDPVLVEIFNLDGFEACLEILLCFGVLEIRIAFGGPVYRDRPESFAGVVLRWSQVKSFLAQFHRVANEISLDHRET